MPGGGRPLGNSPALLLFADGRTMLLLAGFVSRQQFSSQCPLLPRIDHCLERNRTVDKLGRISVYALCDLRAQIGNVLKHFTFFAAPHRQALRKRNCQFQ